MNPDLQMAGELRNTGRGNLFVLFGEPDIELIEEPDGEIRVKVHGIDVFDPPPARSARMTPEASRAGSSTAIITRKASSSARPTSSALMIRTSR
jgi:hypothetical protein